MKSENFKYSVGSLFICSKCGKSFGDEERAEKLKTEIRNDLKEIEGNQKVRVMVGSCLGVCAPDRQTVAYFPMEGQSEIFTTSSDFQDSKTDILILVKAKIKSANK